jgi:hypothetical protein
MALIVADRVKETTTSTGTGNITLAGAATGFQAFSAVCANNDTIGYCIVGGSEWEVGVGTWQTGGTLVRTKVTASSNSNAAVSFSSGTKDVFCSLIANQAAWVLESPNKEASNPDPADDEFGGVVYPAETSLDTGGTRRSGATAWQWRNQGTSTATLSGGRLILSPQADSNLHGVEQALPSGNWKFRANVTMAWDALSPTSEGGMYVVNNANSNLVTMEFYNGGNAWYAQKWNSMTSWNGAITNITTTNMDPSMWIEMEYDGTNIIIRYSKTGWENSFATLTSIAKTTWPGATPTHIGLHASTGSGRTAALIVDRFYRAA